jgi:ABC-type nitrate/sulfonate/bicarbonate transport system ATPase subunit/ABC-type nitrate/sulfonate/bicarbonate transport system permease component
MPPASVSAPAKKVSLRLLGAFGVLIILGLWAIASLAVGSFFVPAPWTTVADTLLLLAQRFTWTQILITALRVLVGFAVGFAAGLVAGVAIGSRKELAALLKPLVLFFQGMPPLLWAIPLVALMGIGHLPTITVIALITFPLVAVTIGEGMATLPRELAEMLSVFAPGSLPRLRELVLPHLAPFLAASLATGVVLAVKASVTAEYFGANNGIGFQIQAAYMSLRIRTLFAWALVLVLVILLASALAPRIRFAGSAIKRRFAAKAPVTCTPEDVRALKDAFTSRARALAPVRLEQVSFSYGKDRAVLRDASLSVSSREIAVITGDSGIGKTTLLKLAGSLLRPSEGRVSRPPRIGFVFQDDRLLPWRTVSENVALPLLYQGYPRTSAVCFAHYLLAEAGLDGDEEKRPEELSGGMKKRAALARCFARLPDAILLDEPFNGVHAKGRVLLWSMFLKLLALHPVPTLVVTHYPEEIASLAACKLYVLEGAPATLRAAAPARRRAAKEAARG